MKKAVIAGLALAAVSLSGCMRHTYDTGNGATRHAPVVYHKAHPHLVWGLTGNRKINVDQLCPSGNATVFQRVRFPEILLAAITGGFFQPTKVTVHCAAEAASAGTVSN